MKEVPDKLDNYLAKKQYLPATNLIVNAGEQTHTDLLFTNVVTKDTRRFLTLKL